MLINNIKINDIEVGGVKYKVGWNIKIPCTRYWIVWLKDIHLIEFVEKFFDDKGYFYNRIGRAWR